MHIKSEGDYQIKGFTTVFQMRKSCDEKVRLLCLVKDSLMGNIRVRLDLMSDSFPSIWLELAAGSGQKGLLVVGFYREWTVNGNRTVERQLQSLEIFCSQLLRASREKTEVVALGDANLCKEKWEDEHYPLKELAIELRGTLAMAGMEVADTGVTYTADRLTKEGSLIRSSLDHIYLSGSLQDRLRHQELERYSTDHLPVLCLVKRANRGKENGTIRKRIFKHFTQEKWLQCLVKQQWEELCLVDDLTQMVNTFDSFVRDALDECAPYGNIKMRPHYCKGLSEATKDLMRQRDKARGESLKAEGSMKILLHKKYKRLRNKVVSKCRREVTICNEERISSAGKPWEMWKVAQEILHPNKGAGRMELEEADLQIKEEKEVAELLNTFFIQKPLDLQATISKEDVKDPLEKLRGKLRVSPSSFSLKTVSENEVLKHIRRLKNKRSSGIDGLTPELLKQGATVLALPITWIINQSLVRGIFPDPWKTASVVPIHKKGNRKQKENYRPVSCLPASSKVLEAVVLRQLTRHA